MDSITYWFFKSDHFNIIFHLSKISENISCTFGINMCNLLFPLDLNLMRFDFPRSNCGQRIRVYCGFVIKNLTLQRWSLTFTQQIHFIPCKSCPKPPLTSQIQMLMPELIRHNLKMPWRFGQGWEVQPSWCGCDICTLLL